MQLQRFFGRAGQFDFGERILWNEVAVGFFFQRQVDRLFAFSSEAALDGNGGFDEGAFAFSRRDPSPIGIQRFFDFEPAEEAGRIGVQLFECVGEGFEQEALGCGGGEVGVGGA